MLRDSKRKIKKYILNREKSGIIWKLATSVITLAILISLYSKGIIAIATINNRPVTLQELLIFLRREDPNSILDKTLTQKIIELEARKRNIIVSKQETEAEIDRLTKEAAESGITIYKLMKTSEEDSKELEKNVKLRITLYKIMSSGEPITEDQIDDYIEMNEDLYEPEEKEQIRTELKYMLLNEKISQDYETFIRDANASTDIDYFIDLDNL